MSSLDDTDPQALALMTALYRRMSGGEKLERVRQLTLAANRLAVAGLASRHPSEGQLRLLRRLASIRLGEPIAERAYEERGS